MSKRRFISVCMRGFNIIRFSVLTILSGGHIKCFGAQYSGLGSKFKVCGGNITLSEGVSVQNNTFIQTTGGCVELGKNVYINRGCMVISRDKIVIDDYTAIGPNVCIYDHDHDYKNHGRLDMLVAPVIIGKNVWIGAGCIILRGTVIGDGCVIGAGTVVKGNIPPNTLMVDKREAFMKPIER